MADNTKTKVKTNGKRWGRLPQIEAVDLFCGIGCDGVATYGANKIERGNTRSAMQEKKLQPVINEICRNKKSKMVWNEYVTRRN